MNTKKETPRRAQAKNCRKDSTFKIKLQVFSLLKSGKHTAIQLNNTVGFNDSRKVISDLRKKGYNIKDYRLAGSRQKVYYLEEEKQLDLFTRGEVYHV